MEVLNKDELLKEDDGMSFEGYLCIHNYTDYPTKNGGTYYGGVVQANGDIQFKTWSGTPAFNTLSRDDVSGSICSVIGKVNEYNGVKSIILDEISVVKEDEAEKLGLNKMMFFYHKYDLESYWRKLLITLKKNVSEQALYIFNLIMNDKYDGDITVKDKFLTEFAALNYHDNCVGGLLAHTTKLENACKVMSMYSEIINRVGSDALYLGIAIHDIGKVFEYKDGVISTIGQRVSHNTYGCLMLAKHQEEIINLKGEDFYWTLISIIAQHHGEYGDRPRTVAAWVINQIDSFDATMTLLNQTLENSDSEMIKFDGLKLV